MKPALISLTLVALFHNIPQLYADKNTDYYVFSQNGINLRRAPNTASDSLGTLGYGQKIEVLGKNKGNILSVRSIRSRWFYVKTKRGKHGYMFSGFLLPLKPPPLKNTERPLRNYAKILNQSITSDSSPGDQQGNYLDEIPVPLSSIQKAFVLLRSIYKIPDDLPFPSMFRNLYVHTDVLEKGPKDWKIHELRVLKRANKQISELQYSLKNYRGVLEVSVTKKDSSFIFSEKLIPESGKQQSSSLKENTSG